MDVFVTGTDTDVGKTVLSAALVVGLHAGYWKPIQTGRSSTSPTDRETVVGWTGIDAARAPREAYVFDPPVSPHQAAIEAGRPIDLQSIERPLVSGSLVIEGAGGVMVPINTTQFMLDLMEHLAAPVILAARTALGTINHTLLSIAAIHQRDLVLMGIVLIGEGNAANRKAIEQYGHVPVVGWIPPMLRIDRQTLAETFDNHFDKSAFNHTES